MLVCWCEMKTNHSIHVPVKSKPVIAFPIKVIPFPYITSIWSFYIIRMQMYVNICWAFKVIRMFIALDYMLEFSCLLGSISKWNTSYIVSNIVSTNPSPIIFYVLLHVHVHHCRCGSQSTSGHHSCCRCACFDGTVHVCVSFIVMPFEIYVDSLVWCMMSHAAPCNPMTSLTYCITVCRLQDARHLKRHEFQSEVRPSAERRRCQARSHQQVRDVSTVSCLVVSEVVTSLLCDVIYLAIKLYSIHIHYISDLMSVWRMVEGK